MKKEQQKKVVIQFLIKLLKLDLRLQLIFLKKFNSFKTQVQHPNISSPSNFYEDS